MSVKFFYKNLLLIVATLTFACNKVSDNVVAYVNHYPITNSELNYWMLLQRAEVFNYYYEEFGVMDSDGFWDQEIEGVSPLEMLKERALGKAVRCKIQQILALEKGVVVQIGFDQIISKMEEENKRRKEKVEKGEVIYGQLKYTKRSFFAHEFDKMILNLKPELLKSELKPTQKELESFVTNSEFSLEKNYGFYQMQYIEENYGNYIDSLVEIANVKLNTENWNAIDANFN